MRMWAVAAMATIHRPGMAAWTNGSATRCSWAPIEAFATRIRCARRRVPVGREAVRAALHEERVGVGP